MNKKQRIILVVSIIMFVFLLFVSSLSTYEAKTSYHRINENEYISKTINQIQPINFDNYNVISIWFFGLILLFVFSYFGLIKPQGGNININKAQKIILAIAIPLMVIIVSKIIITLFFADEIVLLIIVSIALIIITIYEYDLFGKNIIINVIIRAFDFKLLFKIVILFIIFFIGIGLLGEIFSPINIGKEKILRVTKEEYDKQISSEKSIIKFDWDK